MKTHKAGWCPGQQVSETPGEGLDLKEAEQWECFTSKRQAPWLYAGLKRSADTMEVYLTSYDPHLPDDGETALAERCQGSLGAAVAAFVKRDAPCICV
jgi:hypothetical protein